MAVELPDSMSGSVILENILSIRVLELLVILVGCKVKKSINELKVRKSKTDVIMLNIIQSYNIKVSK